MSRISKVSRNCTKDFFLRLRRRTKAGKYQKPCIHVNRKSLCHYTLYALSGSGVEWQTARHRHWSHSSACFTGAWRSSTTS
jgi:hypothetical protein